MMLPRITMNSGTWISGFIANQPETSVGSNFSDTIDRLAKATAISAMAKIAMQR